MNVCVSVCMHVATCVGMALACVCEKRRRSDYGSECGKEMDPQQWGGGTQTEKDRFGTMYLCSSKKLNEKKNTFLWGMCTINTINSIIVISLVPGTYMYIIKRLTNIFYFALLRSLFWSIIIICLTQPGRYLGPTCIGPHKHLFHLVAMDGSLEQCKHTPGTA